ncbi:MAG TPA: DUF1223 domain-containing protein [Rhizomicrobium sp.]|nr:DUF1223 domain-containing protein [Rhizomicrobium sp.]
MVELFTSQGCDSCPPADAILTQLAASRRDVLAMTLPITYWDMLGWKDTFASDADTKRQKAYAQTMGHGGVYTPEMIVDGISDVVGSRETQVNAAIAARAADAQSVSVTLSASKTEVRVMVGSAEGHDDATIWFFRVLPQASVTVTGGENAGHTMTYRNVVRDIRAVGMWKGQPVTLDLPREELTGRSKDSIAVIVQQGGYGRIVGAAMIEPPPH